MTGAELTRQAPASGWECVSFTRAGLDIADRNAVLAAMRESMPHVVINAAAYTAVDDAEDDEATATLVNGDGAGNVAQAAEAIGAGVIHISTDYVFDGASRIPYLPSDPVNPKNAYGRSKLAGELGVRASTPRHMIIRTSWVYSHEGRNFVRTMLRAGETRKEISVVNDQHGSPTSAADLAAALISAAEAMHGNPALAGTYHFSNSGMTTWCDFANTIFKMRGGEIPVVNPILSAEYRTPTARPAWSVLDCSSFENELGIQRRPWQTALRDVMDKIQ